MDLPSIIEIHKTLDNKTLYKTGDVNQVGVVLVGVVFSISLDGNMLDGGSRSTRGEIR